MIQFKVEELNDNLLIHIRLDVPTVRAGSHEDLGPDEADFETVVNGVAWAGRNPDGELVALTIQLGAAATELTSGEVRRLLEDELGLDEYRAVRKRYMDFVKKLELLNQLLPAA